MNDTAPISILIVDDEPSVRAVLAEVLSPPNYAAEVAADGERALQVLSRRPVDLLLIDKNLPGLSGVEVLRRARDLQPDLGVIVMTAYPSYESVLMSMRLGALDYLEKPFDDVDLVRTCVDRAQRRRRTAPPSSYSAGNIDQEYIRRERLAAVATLGAELSHELKNPLTGIVGFSQVGQRRADTGDKARELFAMIERESLRCKEILRGFLQFARPADVRIDALDLTRLVREVVPALAPVFAERSVDLVTSLDTDTPPVMGSRSDLQQVVMNLLRNALEAVESGGHVRVAVLPCPQGGARLEVSDDGPGIAPELHTRLFDPFFTTRRGPQHTGLGLAICYGVVRNHLGDIRVTSQKGSGATFTVDLPGSKN